MHNSLSCYTAAALICSCTIWLAGASQAGQPDRTSLANSIAGPGQPLYYLMADVGSSVGPNEELKRTNRSLMKWWEDLFGQNNCCNNNNNFFNNNNNLPNNNLLYNNNLPPAIPTISNNNCNGLQLQSMDPFKQMKLFKKFPDLWGNTCGGQCGGQCGGGQPVNSYAAPASPGYGGDGYAPAQSQPTAPADYNQAPAAPPSGGYDTPNAAYDGPADGDAGYVAPAEAPPASDSYAAPPASDSYAAPPATPDYEAPAPAPPAPPANSYETPTQQAPAYEPAAPAPAPESYSKVDEYAQPAKSYGGAQLPQIVYQPIIYLSTTSAVKDELETKLKLQEQSYETQTEAPSPPQPAYEPPTPSPPLELPAYDAPPAPAPAPVAPCNAPACAGYLPLLGVPFYSYPTGPAQPAPAYSAPPPPAPVYAPPAPVYAPPSPPPAPVYAAPPAAPPAPSYSSPSCRTPIRLSLVDQPYRVAPELFQEYNYRLGLAEQNRL